jgi:hypothetical protein
MKRLTSLLLVIAFAGAILLPVAATVNNSFSNDNQIADGGGGKPVPPLPPCVFSASESSLST